ncbi:zinc finger BED domain-containing protein 4-like [Dysidea avara]|uniref:zinc finger BED domain-containing protein 4-like n=1 Tax=Dysidea avara TaxID=196820 RepID=UPI003327C99C
MEVCHLLHLRSNDYMYFTEDSLRRKAIDKALVKMLAIDMQPGSIVEDKGFQDFLKVIDPKYIPPSRRTIMRDHLPGLYRNATEKLHTQLMKVEYCSITTNLWTSQATMGYITVTCHFLTDDWELKSVVLETVQIEDSHTAENIASTLLCITDKWNITDKICCAITDNASNIVAAIQHNKWNHLPCFAHTLNLIVSNSLQDVPEVAALLQRCKHIVTYFHRSTKATDKLTSIQSRLNIDNHKLIQEVETRWNSSFYMLERIIEQEEAARTTLCLLNRNDLTISSEEIEVMKVIVEILQPFEAVTREISADSYISGSKIIPLSRALQRLTCSSKKLEVQNLKDNLLQRMNRKFLNIEDNMLLAAPTLLDPRFKKIAFSDFGNAAKVTQYIIREIAASLRLDDSDSTDSTEVEVIVKDASPTDESGLWDFLINK